MRNLQISDLNQILIPTLTLT